MTDTPAEEPVEEPTPEPEPVPEEPAEPTEAEKEVAAKVAEIRAEEAERIAAEAAVAAAEQAKRDTLDAAKAACMEVCGPVWKAVEEAETEREKKALIALGASVHEEHREALENAYLDLAGQRREDAIVGDGNLSAEVTVATDAGA